MAHGQANAETRTDGGSPTLTCVHEAPIAAIPYDLFQITAPINRQNRDERSPCHTLARDNAAHAAVVIDAERQVCPTLTSRMQGSSGWAPYNEDAHLIPQASMSVRRLTPTECERLQGFPDGWTQIPWRGKAASECPDGPRYKALGNSMACNVMRWIGRRIELVEKT
jgi:DNA (cytosine-5)-methyltransferase 1